MRMYFVKTCLCAIKICVCDVAQARPHNTLYFDYSIIVIMSLLQKVSNYKQAPI